MSRKFISILLILIMSLSGSILAFADTESIKASKKMLDMGHVKYRQYIPTGRNVQLSL